MSALNAWLRQLESTPHFLNTTAPERIKIMMQRLGLTKQFFTITIAGTNGKGTTTHLLASYFKAQGFNVGRFTSPHLMYFNERIAVNDIFASDAEIVEAFERIAAVQDLLALTYFDYSFLAALLIFKKHHVNLVCLEVGLGGRLDATNAIDPDFTIITTIDLDHQEQLGRTRELIALEKAGVMRSGVPCVCGDLNPPISLLASVHNIYFRSRHFDSIAIQDTWQLQTDSYISPPLPYAKYIPQQNAVTVLMSLTLLSPMLGLALDLAIFKDLLQNLSVPGRMQVLQEHPQILIDVAHNPESARYLAKQLVEQPIVGKTLSLFSALQDKDIADIVKPLSDIIHTWYVFEINHPRAAPAPQIKEIILSVYPLAEVLVVNDLNGFSTILGGDDRLVVFGSFMAIHQFLAHGLAH
jgi:dihydrofolate synthase/folylpolyglutamate synthase